MGIVLPKIKTMADITDITLEYGFLPFFSGEIEGFSIEEACPGLWDMPEGPWEWKGPIIRERRLAYGKFFLKKAGYVSLELLPDMANLRRDGYDLDARYDDGLCPYKDKAMYELISEKGPLLTDEVKRELGYGKDGQKGFETVITRLQTETYIVVEDFRYRQDKNGRKYGWGVASYAAPESLYGYDFVRSGYVREPAESRELLLERISKKLKNVEKKSLIRLIGG